MAINVSVDDINNLVANINACSIKWFEANFDTELEIGEFKGCCDMDEIRIIQECVDIFLKNNPLANKDDVLRAIVGYYYEVQVLEYYVSQYSDIKDRYTFDCIKKNYNAESEQMVKHIVLSDDSWASEIRRKILNLNVGGKKRAYKKQRRNTHRRKTHRRKTHKRKTHRRKTHRRKNTKK
jgi:hypothetical protein